MLWPCWQMIPIDGVLRALGARQLTSHTLMSLMAGIMTAWLTALGVTKSRFAHAHTEHLHWWPWPWGAGLWWPSARRIRRREKLVLECVNSIKVKAEKESNVSTCHLSLPMFAVKCFPTTNSPCPSVWEIGWLSSSYWAQWTPIVPASGELWRVMMHLPVSDYPESDSNLIDPATNKRVTCPARWMNGCCICPNDLNLMQTNHHNNRDCT